MSSDPATVAPSGRALPRVVLVGDGPVHDAATEELRVGLAEVAALEVTADADRAPGDDTPDTAIIVLVREPGFEATVDTTFAALATTSASAGGSGGAGSEVVPPWRGVLVTAERAHEDVAAALDDSRLRAVIRAPWTPGGLATQVRAQLSRWLRARDPADGLLPRLDRGDRLLEQPDASLLRDLELDDATITAQLTAAVDRALGRRPRLHVTTGTRLTHQGVGVDGVAIVLRGAVALDRHTDHPQLGELRLHHASTGPVIGLLALTQQRRAFFTARATSPVELIHLSIEQLDLALRREPEVAAALAALTVRALANRLRRAEQLQIEAATLNRELDAERRRLRDALDELASARMELVESERFATLGELAAGVAHELNNPVAAMERAVDHLQEDLEAVLRDHPDAPALRTTTANSRRRPLTGTAEDRARRRALQARGVDATTAQRLVAAGLDADTLDDVTLRDAHRLDRLAAAGRLGTALRDLQLAGARISDLVDAVRAHARPTLEPVEGVEVDATIDDALRLLAHRLQDTQVVRQRAEDLAPIRAHPAQLGQIWTNLVGNALDALAEQGRAGTVTIVCDRPDADHVRVQVRDDGPGVAPDALPRLFEPRFTTKQGRVRYGLGQGLAIAKRIVEGHGGTITAHSVPGATVISVRLPVAGPPPERTGTEDVEEQP